MCDVVQCVLVELEGGVGVVLMNIGMLVIYLVIIVFFKLGDLLVVLYDCYGGSYCLFDSLVICGCYCVWFVDQGDECVLQVVLEEKLKLVLVESLSNLLLCVVDIVKICWLVCEVGVVSVVDNMFLSLVL